MIPCHGQSLRGSHRLSQGAARPTAPRGSASRDLRSGLQLKFLIERLLARLFAEADPPWRLKGGYAMELRYRPRARTTRDVDLTIESAGPGSLKSRIESVLEDLRETADRDLGDHLVYRVESMKRALPGAPLGGATFPVQALLAGRPLGRFQLDVGMGDHAGGEPEVLDGDDLLAFAGVPAARALVVPKPQQFAEKFYAYTYPWEGRENTRTKDLIDLLLLIERGSLEAESVRAAIEATFDRRGSHTLPSDTPRPPDSWSEDFERMALQVELVQRDLNSGYAALHAFLAPIIGGIDD